MERTPAENDHDSGKSGQSHRNLSGQTKSLAWFHRYCFYQTRRIMASRTQHLSQSKREQARRFFELALVSMRLDHAASFIVNANHGIM
jgi:hypothetical protein